jgi:hypothetical protein
VARRSKKKNYFERGKPVHLISYCAFLDVLGFSQRICESYENREGDRLLQQFHSIFNKQLKRLREETNESMLYFKTFSDNVLLAHPGYSPDMESEFGFVMWALSRYQLEMALNGFFIRGGFAVGSLFVDDNSVYGGALIEAYQLESTVAINPIVVLSDNVMKFVDEHSTYYLGEMALQEIDILINEKGRYFINYLAECINEDDQSIYVEPMLQHKANIEYSLAKHKHNPGVFEKFRWLAAYHNYFCGSISKAYNYLDDLLVVGDIADVNIQRFKKKKREE